MIMPLTVLAEGLKLMSNQGDNELFSFAEETSEDKGKRDSNCWWVLIIDDEKGVHSATEFALKNTVIMDRPLKFLHAMSASEGIRILKENKNIAVIMLDVVMETPNAGLDMVAVIRDKMAIRDTRIILRTGQPNQAPEIEVIRDYDINDYKLKSELTQSKLYAALTTAIRSYKQIRMIEAGRKGLDMIVRSSSELLTKNGIHAFAQGVIVHLAGLLDIPAEGLICVRRQQKGNGFESKIIAAAGHYCLLVDHPLNDLTESGARALLDDCLTNKSNQFGPDGVALYIGSDTRGDMSAFISSDVDLDSIDQSLLEIFCNNIAACADNLMLLERLSSHAYYDMLVGLPNRNALIEKIDELTDDDNVPELFLALVDVDSFAELNAALGKDYCDELLREIGLRLLNAFPVTCTIARIAADVFAVLGPEDHVRPVVITEVFTNAFRIGGNDQTISVTSGIVPLAEMSDGGGQAIKEGSIVLKSAKAIRRGEVVMFNRSMVDKATQHVEMLRELREAFEEDKLFLAFQPKFDISTLDIVGLEALIRWENANGVMVPPQRFIPLAEKSGLIVRMGEWVMEKAVAELNEMRGLGWDELKMGVNFSVAQLRHPEILGALRELIDKVQVDPSLMDLEITETIAMDDVAANMEVLTRIKDIGFELSVDDFGTGFSSLSYLQKMPFDNLKVDQSFVQTSDTDSGRKIVEMIVNLGKTLGMNVIAEGVETKEQLALLRELGCQQVQGFLLAKPMSGEELAEWLVDYKKNGLDL